MARLKRLLLDVLKPNHPGLLELATSLTEGADIRARLRVLEMDEQTQTLQIEITGTDIDFEQLQTRIEEFGASLHSIDEVEMDNRDDVSG